MYEIRLEKQPIKFLEKSEKQLSRRIISKLRTLKENPIPYDSRRVIGYELPTFRMRIGKYRILYRVDYQENLIVIVKIDKRSRIYR